MVRGYDLSVVWSKCSEWYLLHRHQHDLPVIPIATYKTLYMYEPGRVRGFTHHPRLEQHPARWRIERD